MSKFDYDCFCGDYNCLGFNAAKYTQEEALEIGAKEYECSVQELSIRTAYIYYGFGVDEEGKNRQCYWISEVPTGNSFKAWAVTRE